MKTKSGILLITLVAVSLASLTIIYLLNTSADNLPNTSTDRFSTNGEVANTTQTVEVGGDEPFEGLRPPTPFSVFTFVRDLEDAQKKVELFTIKVPPQSVLLPNYRFVGAILDQ